MYFSNHTASCLENACLGTRVFDFKTRVFADGHLGKQPRRHPRRGCRWGPLSTVPKNSRRTAEKRPNRPKNSCLAASPLFVGVLLSGPVRDTPRLAQYFFEIASQRGFSHPFCLVFMWYRACIAEIPFCGGRGESQLHFTCSPRPCHGGNAQKRGWGYRTQLAHVETPNKIPHSAQKRGGGVSLR